MKTVKKFKSRNPRKSVCGKKKFVGNGPKTATVKSLVFAKQWFMLGCLGYYDTKTWGHPKNSL